jgi:hypothetical protein
MCLAADETLRKTWCAWVRGKILQCNQAGSAASLIPDNRVEIVLEERVRITGQYGVVMICWLSVTIRSILPMQDSTWIAIRSLWAVQAESGNKEMRRNESRDGETQMREVPQRKKCCCWHSIFSPQKHCKCFGPAAGNGRGRFVQSVSFRTVFEMDLLRHNEGATRCG